MDVKRAIALVGVLALAGAIPAQAQPAHQAIPHGNAPYCGTLIGHADFDHALARFAQARKAGRNTVARKSASPPDIGDRETFKVYVYATNSWAEMQFELRDKTNFYHAWVEVANLAQLTQQELDIIRANMLSQTPPGSITPAAGVMANNNTVFGEPPNVDGDGVVDFLFYDIDNQNVGGYVHPGDLDLDGAGNGKDVLHLDIFQSVSFMPRLIAHEYTHLIHFNYEFDVETFISEGLAEYAMVVNGYTQDNFAYLSFPTEHKRGLFSWRGVDDQNGGRDYDRGRLFFSYLAERVGPMTTGSMLRNDRKGATGIDSILVKNGLELGEVIGDFHTANWVFDSSVADKYGYTRSFSAPLAPIPDLFIDTSQSSATPEADPEDSPNIEGGAVNYIHLSELGNLSLNFDAYAPAAVVAIQPGILDDIRSRLQARLVATRDDGQVITMDVPPSPSNFPLEGNYTDGTLVFTIGDPIKSARYSFAASWGAFGTGTHTETAPLPQQFSLTSVFPNPLRGTGNVLFDIADPGAVRLNLVDPLGRPVRTFQPGYLGAGTHTLPIDSSGLAAGTYLLVLETAGGRSSRLLVVLP